jgi:hypothetical protein
MQCPRPTAGGRAAAPPTLKPSIAKKRTGAAGEGPAAGIVGGPELTATVRVICTSPPGPKLDGFPVDLGLRDAASKDIVLPTTPVAANCPTCSWEFPVHFQHDPARRTKSRNPFPGQIRGDYVERGKGDRNEDFYMYMRIMQNKRQDYVFGLKITMGCITWQQVLQAQAPGLVIETSVPGPHMHVGMVTGQKQRWDGWSVVSR